MFGSSRGLPWWAAVLVALVLSGVAAVVDMNRAAALGGVYTGGYVLGCVAAIALVRRRNLFGPMVQPPLIFAVTAILALAWLSPDKGQSGLKELLITVALPLTSTFPTMAITTAICLAIGIARIFTQRDPDREEPPKAARPPKERRQAREPKEPRKQRPPRDEAGEPAKRPRDPNRKPPRKPRP